MARRYELEPQLVERVDDGKLRREIRIVLSNSGRFIANMKIGTTTIQVPVSGATPESAMAAAKRWLNTPIYKR